MPTPPTFTAGAVLTAAQMNIISSLLTPTGSILPYTGSTAPTSFLLCFGQAVSRTTYADLFAVTGTTYGVGDGSTTFNLPDLRGRVIAGLDNMGGTAAGRLTSTVLTASNTLGATGGTQTHTLTTPEIPSHQHTVPTTKSTVGGTGVYFGQGADVQGQNSGFTGGGGAHLNTQPTLVLNYIVKI